METLKTFFANNPLLAAGLALALFCGIGLVPIGKTTYPIPGIWRWILFAVAGVLIILGTVSSLRGLTAVRDFSNVSGGIKRPVSNEKVATTFDAEGWANNVLKNQHLWLVVVFGTKNGPRENFERTKTAPGVPKSSSREPLAGRFRSASMWQTRMLIKRFRNG